MSTKLTPASVEVDTLRYAISHGKAPRGFGGWMFETARGAILWSGPASTYAAARKAAKQRAAEVGQHVIYVCP